MLDTLTFLLAHIKLSSLLPPSARETVDPPPPPRFDSAWFQRGDLLEVPRTLFTHFGIYLGENRVAHLIPDILPVLTSDPQQVQLMVTNTRLLLGVLCKRASVRVDSVEDFAYGARILQNAMDRVVDRQPLGDEEVARRAEQLLGGVAYSLLWNNCEHFVTRCRYGSAQSLQTQQDVNIFIPERGCEHFVTCCRYGSAQSLQTQQFCEGLKALIRDRRVVILTALLGLLSLVCLGVSSGTALLSLLVPFTLWMAS